MGSESAEETGVPKVLARNSACHQCRKRKLKCDALRPVCTNCQKPRVRGVDRSMPPEVECTWDEPREPSRRRRKEGSEDDVETKKKARLYELEQRIASFENQLKSHSAARSSGAASSEADTQSPSATITKPPFSDWNSANETFKPKAKSASASDAIFVVPENQTPWNRYPPADLFAQKPWMQHILTDDANMIHPMDSNVPPSRSETTDFGAGFEGNVPDPRLEQAVMDDLFSQLMWSDWPKDLPTPEVVYHVVTVFFDKVPTYPKMLHRPTFMQNLHLPPKHRDFPAVPLIHAIVGLAANWISPTSLATRAYFPVGSSRQDIVHPEHDFDPPSVLDRRFASGSSHIGGKTCIYSVTPLGRFQLWHRRKTFEGMSTYLDQGLKFLECLQAHIIASAIDQFNAWWTDFWMESASATRMAVPMLLNESPNRVPGSLERTTLLLMPDNGTAIQQAEKDRTWWMAYYLERSSTLSTTWPGSVSDDEVTVELPVIQSLYDSGAGQLSGLQTMQSADLFSRHPEIHQDGFVLCIKALKLYTDVNTFFRRYSRRVHSVSKYIQDPTLRLLLSQINSFRMAIPPHMRRPTQHMANPDGIDVDLVTAIMVAHAAVISLAEPLINRDTWRHEIAKLGLTAIRAILSLLYDITATSYDLSRLPPSATFTWTLSAKVMCRFIDAATAAGDTASAGLFQSELNVFKLSLTQYGERYPVGLRQLRMIDEMLRAQQRGEGDLGYQLGATCVEIDYENKTFSAVSGTTSTSGDCELSIPTPSSVAGLPPLPGVGYTKVDTLRVVPLGTSPSGSSGSASNTTPGSTGNAGVQAQKPPVSQAQPPPQQRQTPHQHQHQHLRQQQQKYHKQTSVSILTTTGAGNGVSRDDYACFLSESVNPAPPSTFMAAPPPNVFEFGGEEFSFDLSSTAFSFDHLFGTMTGDAGAGVGVETFVASDMGLQGLADWKG